MAEDMIIYPAAEYDPAPRDKRWGQENARAGVILHSMVGGWGSARSRLMDPNQQASWHYSVLKDGRVLAHYDLSDSPWHGGSYQNNVRLIGIEHEGGAPGQFDEPLTPSQLSASIDLVWWIASQCGWTPSRYDNKTLFEHREVHATQCPSGRIPWERYLIDPAPFGEDEPEVKTRALDQAETIAALNAIAKAHGDALNDTQGQTILEVTEGYPYPPPAGTRWFLATGRD